MAKKCVGAEAVTDDQLEQDEQLRTIQHYKKLMEEKPNFNKKKDKYDPSQKVYEKDNFVILKVHSGNKVGYIAYNTNKEWKDGHTHLKSFDMAKTIISNVQKHKKPKTKNIYLMRSHARLSDDPSYIRYIEQLIDAKKSKQKQNYRNRSM